MNVEFTNFDCIECGEESPYGLMRIPFMCKCNHKNNWSTLPKNIFKGNEYPESLRKFYSVFHQPERPNPEDHIGENTKMICDGLNSAVMH